MFLKSLYKDSGNYYKYLVAYEIVMSLNLVHVEVEHIYFESESGEVPSEILNRVEVTKLSMSQRFRGVVNVKMTKVVKVGYKEYKRFNRGS